MTEEATECANCGEAGHPGHHWLVQPVSDDEGNTLPGGYVCFHRPELTEDAPPPELYR